MKILCISKQKKYKNKYKFCEMNKKARKFHKKIKRNDMNKYTKTNPHTENTLIPPAARFHCVSMFLPSSSWASVKTANEHGKFSP